MKSKRKIFIVAITLIFVIILTLCGSKTQLNSEKISSIRIQALPSPPKFKDIDKKEDIERIASFLNDLPKEEIKDDGRNGWQFFIEVNEIGSTYYVSFLGDRLYIDKKCYKIDDKVLNEFRELYNSLQYEEKSYNQW
ncbi:hypothetical protein [Clostridium paraputrificum]|uniref:hypothetical protein n=1 Tax=Clostridium paraputrificum TaxID=29363 RepID=UPI00189CA910|nr:hypothetical protein [Clostridium paraputrificum]MDB2115809.1 hypothetical protein [Clostridium paraputrificum]